MSVLPKFKRASPSEFARRMAEHEKDQEDARCKTGKYAPPSGVCAVCGGKVVGRVAWGRTGMIGGPPPLSYVAGWNCEDCGIEYHHLPKEKKP